jgi:N-acetylmuramoyl-L-alanine amidase
MTQRSLRYLIAFAALVVFAGPSQARPTVNKVRHAVKDEQTRVVIDVTTSASYEVKRFENPDRIAINIPKVNLSGTMKALDIESGVVSRVRFNRLSWGSQVVLDLRRPGGWSDFYLSPMDGMPYRIVLDVLGEGAVPTAMEPAPILRKAVPSVDKPPAAVKKPAPAKKRSFVVAIDAGHGGSDPGASRGKLVEKTAALDIARRLQKEIDAQPGYKAFLTRDKDVFLSLPSRTKIASDKGADIFVSIHLNSAPKRKARGSEVFFLSPSGAQATANRFLRNKNEAARELGLQGKSSDDILHMLVDVNQQSMMQRSSLLAEEILKAIRSKNLPPTRSVKQRSFAVLKSVAMPSVMVETGFVTNSSDARILGSSSGRDRVAKAVAGGVISFLKKYPPVTEDTGRIFVHRVKKGDTLWRISRKYRTSVASIQKSNRLGSSKLIRVGQELVIREKNETY